MIVQIWLNCCEILFTGLEPHHLFLVIVNITFVLVQSFALSFSSLCLPFFLFIEDLGCLQQLATMLVLLPRIVTNSHPISYKQKRYLVLTVSVQVSLTGLFDFTVHLITLSCVKPFPVFFVVVVCFFIFAEITYDLLLSTLTVTSVVKSVLQVRPPFDNACVTTFFTFFASFAFHLINFSILAPFIHFFLFSSCLVSYTSIRPSCERGVWPTIFRSEC